MITKILVFVIIAIIICVALYFILSYDSGHTVIMNSYDYFEKDKEIKIGNNYFPKSDNGIKYSLSFWIKTNNISMNGPWDSSIENNKEIITKDGSPNVLFIAPNTLRIQICYKDKDAARDYYNFDFEMYEAQTWNNFVIVVNNQKVIIYKNALIERSKIIDNIHLLSKKMMNIGSKNNNFYGYLGYIDYYNYNLSSEQIKNLYYKRKNNLP